MDSKTVDFLKLQVNAQRYSSQNLKGILKVLADMHCKGMSSSERTSYLQELADSMNEFDKNLMNSSKPVNP